jgi:hypothetical protein
LRSTTLPFVKVHFDTSINKEEACVAIVGRNHKLKILFCQGRTNPGPRPLKEKAKATLLIATKAIDLGYKQVIQEMPLMLLYPYRLQRNGADS